MSKKIWSAFVVVCAFAMLAGWAAPARAQMPEVKEKPRMYTYVAFWTIPRAQWADEAKQNMTDDKTTEKDIADGLIVAYGDDTNLVHQVDGPTHDTWFSAMSMGNLLKTLDQFYKSGSTTSAVDLAATKHWDGIFVSRYYNWHPGSVKEGYSSVAMYTLKADAPHDAVDFLSKNLFVPILEQQLADGTILEYEIDTEAIHTEAPGTIWVNYIAANADALDKVSAAVRAGSKENPLRGPAISSMVDFTPHRDYLVRTNATYK